MIELINRTPDRACIFSDGVIKDCPKAGEEFTYKDVKLSFNNTTSMAVKVSADNTGLSHILLRWQVEIPVGTRIMCDHWERAYGDLEWKGLVPQRVMPWYGLLYLKGKLYGAGVMVQPSSFCSWQIDSQGIQLLLDIRNGTRDLVLKCRTLEACSVIFYTDDCEDSVFQAAGRFMRLLSPQPRLPKQPVYGGNNWYNAYGISSDEEIMSDTRRICSLAAGSANRPFMVIDDCWQFNNLHTENTICAGGPWDKGNSKFPDMPGLVNRMKEAGARPGIWIRPLAAAPETSDKLLLDDCRLIDRKQYRRGMDPSHPEVLEQVKTDFSRFNKWGVELIKFDFTTWEIFGRWGFQMEHMLTQGDWGFHRDDLCTAEIILELYRTMRDGAGSSYLLGCNTVGHLGAGLFELQRTGDDTSGRDWERTRRMGINTLAFRNFQHNKLFAVDGDCVGVTGNVPWELNRNWLELLSLSGTPLFVSIAADAFDTDKEKDIRMAFDYASQEQSLAEPLDWLDNNCPERWLINGEERGYKWIRDEGIDLFHTS